MEEFVTEILKLEDDEMLLNEIMARYGQDVIQLVYSYVRNQAIAEDLTQEIFVKCYKSLHTYKQNSKIKTWLSRIAINHCKDYLRSWHHRKVMVSDQLADITGASGQNVEQTILTQEADNELSNAVLTLPMKYREVIYLFYFEEMTLKEIELVLGINHNTIKSRLRRAKVLLKNELERCENG
jgi:RNA polymerase sigma-70 factor, ECF subfamily